MDKTQKLLEREIAFLEDDRNRYRLQCERYETRHAELVVQLAEMREALEDLLEHGGMGGYPAAKACDKAKDALSAAPKRGRK